MRFNLRNDDDATDRFLCRLKSINAIFGGCSLQTKKATASSGFFDASQAQAWLIQNLTSARRARFVATGWLAPAWQSTLGR